MRDKAGNKLTFKEFMERWGEGIQKVTPFQQTKVSLMGVTIILIGIIIGVVTMFILHNWWLFMILLGSLFVTLMSFIGTLQKYMALKKINKLLEGGLNEQEESTT